jgi:hypothetical protein
MPFYVVYPDGRKFGPATVEILSRWVQEGRITAMDWAEDETGAKVQVGQVSGFVPSVASEPPLPAYAPPGSQQWAGYSQPATPARRSPVGLIVGIVCVLLVGFGGLIWWGASSVGNEIDQASVAPFTAVSQSNAKELGAAVLAYARDHGGRFPPNMKSAQAAMPQLARYVSRPDVYRSANPVGAEFMGNRALGGAKVSDVPNQRTTPMFYESRPWDGDTRVVVYVDGHVEQTAFDPLSLVAGAHVKAK